MGLSVIFGDETMDKFYAVIMAGGRGERFWPLSTSSRPKQMISMFGGKSLMAMAVERLEGLIPIENIFVVTSDTLVAATREAAPGLKPENVIGEPMGRDTAAAVALGSALVASRDPNAAFCVVTADHIIGDLDIFRATLRDSLTLALEDDLLFTIGITPTFPSTGFGYIDAGDAFEYEGSTEILKARRFVEKPDESTAREYVDAGHYYWNAGMFVWSVSSIRRALASFTPALHAMALEIEPCIGTPQFETRLREVYEPLERISIDYAVMEKSDNILMARGKFAWGDVGTWTAIENHFEADAAGNTIVGRAETVDSGNNIVVSEGRVTALLGVDDLVVVHAEHATLICTRDRAEDIKQLVAQLKDAGHEDVL